MRSHRFYLTAVTAVVLALTATAFGQNAGFDIARMDKSAEACTDFFQFANGKWVEETKIPDSESRWGSFNILAENNRELLRNTLEKASSNGSPAKGSDTQMIGDFYGSCIAEDAIERAGARPLMPVLRDIEKIRNREDLVRHIAKMHNMGIGVIFGFGGGPDLKDSKMNIANAGQGGLSMPNKDYYVDGDPKFRENRDKFREYMQKMFMLLGANEEKARKDAFTVMRIQTELAYSSLRRVELRDPDKRYSKVSLEEAGRISPNFSWKEYMAFRGTPEVDSFNIGQPDFFKAVNGMLENTSIEEWKTYLKWMAIDAAAPLLSKDFRDANFDFYGRYLQGRKEQQPRWRQCVQATDGAIGEALGQEYVKQAFKPEAKVRMNELIDNLFAAFRERLDNLEWMGDETKAQALSKLLTFKRKIGYPDKLRGYEGLKIERGSYIGNVQRTTEFQIKRNLQDIGQPVDPDRWFMTPPTVNAYYSPILNEIVFPAGILQPPFFNFDADDAINYGAIGAVIGHEITHGFDDQGSRFDAEGNLKMWWTPDDRKQFDDRAACVVNQFSSYEVQPKLFMDGKLTLGENIADLGGLTVAYDAYIRSLEKNGRPENIDGFTPEQRFFLGWAQVWAVKATQEFERLQVSTDPHAIARWRVNGPVSNMPQFAKAYGCGGGTEMVRRDYCQIW